LKHASLFSGIGAADLAAEWMGWENIFQCEKDEFCLKVLEKNFPKTKRYGDIKQFAAGEYMGAVDILTGGFPCQPYSQAGLRKGTEDDRHLWPEYLRIIREIQPGFVVGENVYGIINWSEGLVFEQVQTDLEAIGYEVQAVVLPACGINAPHKRDRVWFVAYSESNFRNIQTRNERSLTQAIQEERFNESFVTTNTNSKRREGGKTSRNIKEVGRYSGRHKQTIE